MPWDSILSGTLLTTGGTGLVVIIALFIRKIIASTSRDAARSGAEVDILNMWKVERDMLKALTEELQRERVELMIKLSNVQQQLRLVQEQLSILVKDKKELVAELRDCEQRCLNCPHRKE